jgi:hypothetical protein
LARPLEYKRRVRLPDFEAPPMPRPRKTPVVAVGLAAWAASVAFAWGVRAGTIPVGSWLAPSPDEPSRPIARQRSRAPAPLPPPPAVALPPLEPVPPPPPESEPEPEPAVASNAPPEPSLRVALRDEPPLPRQSTAAEPWVPTPAPTFDAPARRTTIDSVLPLPNLGPSPAPDPAPRSTRTDVPAPPGGTSVGKSCEAAAAEYRDEIVVGKDRGPADLTAADYAAVLNRGSWFSHCGLPDRATLDVCVAVQNGRAKGVTVRTTPRDGGVELCIARAAAGLSFPSHPRLDVARSRF